MFVLGQADICADKTAVPLEHNNSRSWAEQEMCLYPKVGYSNGTIYWLLDQFGNSFKNLWSLEYQSILRGILRGRLDENHDFFSGKTSWIFTMPLIKNKPYLKVHLQCHIDLQTLFANFMANFKEFCPKRLPNNELACTYIPQLSWLYMYSLKSY